jgi:cyclin K
LQEETPKKCRDIIRKATTILSSQKFASFGEDPKEEVITMERILLKTIKFDLQVDHPYRFLIEYAKSLKSNGSTPKEQVVQKAWNFINDSLETTLCLQWEPEIIAVAMMYLACKISKYDVIDWKGRTPEHQKWWDMFVKDMTKNILEDICHQVRAQRSFFLAIQLTFRLSRFLICIKIQKTKQKCLTVHLSCHRAKPHRQ